VAVRNLYRSFDHSRRNVLAAVNKWNPIILSYQVPFILLSTTLPALSIARQSECGLARYA
jgi:hypothetical protein